MQAGGQWPEAQEGFCYPLCMCPCLNCHHVFYIKKRIKKLLWNSMLCIYKRKKIKEKSKAINNQLKTGRKGGNLGERAGSSAERRRGALALRKLRVPASGASPGPAPPSCRGSDRGARSQVSCCPLWFLQEPESPAPGAGMAGDTEARESPWVPLPLLTVA